MTPRQRRPGRTPAGSSSPHFPEDHTRQTKVRRKASPEWPGRTVIVDIEPVAVRVAMGQ